MGALNTLFSLSLLCVCVGGGGGGVAVVWGGCGCVSFVCSSRPLTFAHTHAAGRVHWRSDNATTVDIEVDPQRCRLGRSQSDFVLQ
jgi:hypothetical protein